MSNPPSGTPSTEKVRLFLSYGRADAEELAERLEADLSLLGFEVWRDRRKIRSGREWDDEIEAGLRTSQLVVAVLTPHAVREESVCRDELAFARFACKLPIVPALAEPCEPPFVIFRLDYIDLTAWRDSPDRYKLGFRRLLDAIQAHFRGEPPRYRRWDDRFPQFDFGPFLYDKRRDFCGREWLFQRIDAWRADRDRHRALLITGDPGIGKSAIVAQLVHMNPGGQVLAYHCCRADTPETLRPGRFIRGLAGMIASQLEAYASQLDDPQVEAALGEARCETDPASAFEEGILNPLHRVPTPAGGARYILIDALDEALAVREGLSIVTLLSPSRLDRLPGWLRVVATTRKEPDVLRRLSGLRAEEIRADEPHNLDDIERFLAHRLGQPGLHGRLQASGVSEEEAIRRLREKSGGNFLWTEQALLGLEAGTHDFAHLDALPTGLTGLYTAFFERHFPDDASYAPARRVLEVVTAAREPLTPAEIAAVTGLDPDYALPPLLDRLAAYLPDRDGRRAVFHKSFADWLTETQDPRPLAGSSSARGGATSGWPTGAGRNTDVGRRRCRPTPCATCLLNWSRPPAGTTWRALLRDLPFLEAKAEAGYVFDLAMEFTRAIEAMPLDHAARRHLRLIEQALRSDLHFLARHPTALFQCLWNRCWWYDCPAAAAHHDPPPGGWPADGPPWGRPGADRLATLLESWRRRSNEEPPPSPGCGRSARPRFLSAAPSWPASAGTTAGRERGVRPGGSADRQRVGGQDGAGLGRGLRRRAGLPPRARAAGSRAWRSTGRGGGSSAGRRTRRCGSGTRPPAPSWPASAGTTTGSRAWRSTGRAADRQRVVGQDGAGLGRGLRRRAGLPPRARRRWVSERGVRPARGRRIVSGSCGPRRCGSWDAAIRRRAGLPPRARRRVRSVAFDRRVGGSSAGRSDKTVRVWDAATGDCLEVIQGFGDVAAIAAPASVFPWRAMSRNWETVIEPASGGEAIAWFPAALEHHATHPSGRIWAGSVGNHLYLIRLEGDPDLIPRGGDS